ncbi:MAG: histidine kinase [Cytophagaceae bacterium]|nr:histidine kinase [Cytophagaceae bacterium]
MKGKYIVLYHAIYWIYRIVNTLVYNHFLYHENWYKGAYVVQLVLMPFFYVNYAILIPSLIEKKYTKFILLTSLWTTLFAIVYANWTIYQRTILYGEALRLPDYTETANNLIYIWLISACFCLFEYWITTFTKNQSLALDRKKHVLQSEENKMLNQLLSDYLDALDHKTLDTIPDGIMQVSDFFKYVLYSRGKKVVLGTELEHVLLLQELTNTHQTKVRIQYGALDDQVLVRSCCVIYAINRLLTLSQTNGVLEVTVETDKQKEVLVWIKLTAQTPQGIIEGDDWTAVGRAKVIGDRFFIALD